MAPKSAAPRDRLNAEYQALVEKFMPMARHEARKLMRTVKDFIDYDTLESEAFYALTDAAARYPGYCVENNYDVTNLDYFQYYVTQSVRGRLLDYMRKQTHLTRTEYDLAKQIKALVAAGNTYAQVAQSLEIKESTVRSVLVNVREFPLSIDLEVDKWKNSTRSSGSRIEDESPTLVKMLSVGAEDPESKAIFDLWLGQFIAIVSKLPSVEQTILAMHYYSGYSMKDISSALGIPSTRVSTIHKEALVCIVNSFYEEVIKGSD